MLLSSVIFTIFAAVVLPVGLAIFACTRKKGYWMPLVAGVCCFVVFQMLTRLPLLQYVLPNCSWFVAMAMAQPILYVLFLALTAALFEELGRYLVMRLFLKKQLSVSDGISFGIGHGGIEAILLVGLNYVVSLIIYGTVAFASAPESYILAAGVERISAMMMQIAFSLMVMLSIKRKKAGWLLLALLLHTAVDFLSLISMQFASALDFSVWFVEAGLLFVAILLGWFVLYEYKLERAKANSAFSPEP